MSGNWVGDRVERRGNEPLMTMECSECRFAWALRFPAAAVTIAEAERLQADVFAKMRRVHALYCADQARRLREDPAL